MNISSVAAAVLTPVIMGYLLKSFPVEENPDDFPAFAKLEERWGRVYWISNITALPAMVVGVYLTWLILVLLAKSTAADTTDALIVYQSSEFMQLLPAIFVGIFATAAVLLTVSKLLLSKEQLREFIYYQHMKSGGNSLKLLARMAMVIVPLSLLLSILLAGQYALFQQDKIVINRFTSLQEKHYKYSDIQSIEHSIINSEATGEESDPSYRYTLNFSDGKNWDTNSAETLDSTPEKDESLADFLQKKTNLKVIDGTQP